MELNRRGNTPPPHNATPRHGTPRNVVCTNRHRLENQGNAGQHNPVARRLVNRLYGHPTMAILCLPRRPFSPVQDSSSESNDGENNEDTSSSVSASTREDDDVVSNEDNSEVDDVAADADQVSYDDSESSEVYNSYIESPSCSKNSNNSISTFDIPNNDINSPFSYIEDLDDDIHRYFGEVLSNYNCIDSDIESKFLSHKMPGIGSNNDSIESSNRNTVEGSDNGLADESDNDSEKV